MRTHLALTLIVVCLSCSTAARAEIDSAARSQAETLVENGIRFARSGDFEDAIEQFEAALKLYPNAEIMHSLARAHEEAGHLSKAHSWFGKALSTAPNYLYAEDARGRIERIEGALKKTHGLVHIRSTPSQVRVSITSGDHSARHLTTPVSWWIPAGRVKLTGERSGFEPREEDVTVQAGEVRTLELVLTPIQAKGFLAVTASEVGAMVKVDGQVVGKTPLPTLTLTEGTHVIEVQADGGLPMTKTVTIIANEAAPAVAFNLSPPPTAATSNDDRVLWAGISFGGSLGLAALGAVFHSKYWNKGKEGNDAFLVADSLDDLNDAAGAKSAHDQGVAAWDEANQAKAYFITCYGVGGALVGVGLYMLLKDPSETPPPSSGATSWHPTFSAGPDHVELGTQLRF